MTSVTHMAAGMAMTQLVPNPLISLPLALSSHFILDAIPHNDYIYLYFGQNWQRMHESGLANVLNGVALGLCVYLAFHTLNPFLALTGAFLGVLPDVASALLKRYQRVRNPFFRFHNALHSTSDWGEWCYNCMCQRSKKVSYPDNSKEFKENYKKISSFSTTRLGWTVSLFFEVSLLIIFLWIILV